MAKNSEKLELSLNLGKADKPDKAAGKRSEQQAITLPSKLRDTINSYCKAKHMTASEFYRAAARYYMEEHR